MSPNIIKFTYPNFQDKKLSQLFIKSGKYQGIPALQLYITDKLLFDLFRFFNYTTAYIQINLMVEGTSETAVDIWVVLKTEDK